MRVENFWNGTQRHGSELEDLKKVKEGNSKIAWLLEKCCKDMKEKLARRRAQQKNWKTDKNNIYAEVSLYWRNIMPSL